MAQEIKLSDRQLKLFKDAHISANEAANTARQHIEVANTKKKALEDLILMFCDSHNISDPTKLNIDLDRGVAIEPDASDTATS